MAGRKRTKSTARPNEGVKIGDIEVRLRRLKTENSKGVIQKKGQRWVFDISHPATQPVTALKRDIDDTTENRDTSVAADPAG